MMEPIKDSREKERPRWDNKVQYLLSCIGFAVGLGNVWRFPYLCQIYGGGAFLIPYLVALVFEGLPLLYLELAVGQRFRNGSIGVWNSISPYLGGIGIASMMISFLVSLFYNAVLAWVLWYFVNSFRNPLPWAHCPLGKNNTGLNEECVRSTAVSYFWYHETLNITADIETSGTLQWWLVACLAFAWLTMFLCFIRGIKSMGKAVYVTATFPYLVLTIFLVRALTLPGATEGLLYLITPDWEKLKNPAVWLDAATQIFFSLSVAFGGLIAYSSYNKDGDNCERDALLVAVINSATSLYASVPIFGILGFKATNNYKSCLKENILTLSKHIGNDSASMTPENYQDMIQVLSKKHAQMSNLELKQCDLQMFLDKSASGPGLAFIVFTEAVMEMPGPQWWAILFFIMLFSLGLSSMFGMLEGILTPIVELKLVPPWVPQGLVTAVVCSAMFSISLIFTLGSGAYWVDIFNNYAGSIPLLIVALLEIVGVIYVYGIKNFSDDIQFMTGKRPNIYWKACWTFISPMMLLVVFIAYVVLEGQQRPTYEAWNPAHEFFPQAEVKLYPEWIFAIIVLLCVLPVISIPLVLLCRLIYCRATRSTHPSPSPDPNKALEAQMRRKRTVHVITFVPENICVS